MSEKEKLDIDLYLIQEEAKNKEKIRKNPKKYEVSEKRVQEIKKSLKPVKNIQSILVA